MSISLDGSGANGDGNSQSSFTMTFSTTNPNDIILVAVRTHRSDSIQPSVSSVTAPGLSFTKRKSITHSVATFRYETSLWYAVASTVQTNKVVTVNLSNGSASLDGGVLMAYSGCNTAAIWDSNASLPATATGTTANPTVNISTTKADTRLIGIIGEFVAQTAGSGYSIDKLGSGSVDLVTIEGKNVTSPQTSVAVNTTAAAGNWEIIGDALVAATNHPPSRAIFIG